MEYDYKISFVCNGHNLETTVPSIGHAINGFWVNDQYEYFAGYKVKYYIMPHHITKIEVEREDD